MSTAPGAERQTFPDELRGVALVGIAVVNAPFLGMSLNGFVRDASTTWLDRAVEFAVVAFAQGKFYLLFAFLFGYSAHLMLRDGSRERTRTFRRRLVGLAVLGILHAVLFFVGDILLSYAVLGIALLFSCRWSERSLRIAAAVSAGCAAVWLILVALVVLTDPAATANGSVVVDEFDSAMRDGSFVDAATARWEALPDVLVLLGSLNWGLALSAFFLGMLAGRRGLLLAPDADVALWRTTRRVALPVGLLLGVLSAWLVAGPGSLGGVGTDPRSVLGVVVGFVSAPLLSIGYVGCLVRLVSRRPAALRTFRVGGRASLSLYVGESVVLSFLFCGWGLGLFGRIGAAAVVAIALLTWAGLEVGAHLWLRRFSQGPLERLLRTWSRGSRPAVLPTSGHRR